MINREQLYPFYVLTDDLDADTAMWLREQQGVGPLALADITDMCATFKVRAELRDTTGCVVGSVNAEGDYRLVP